MSGQRDVFGGMVFLIFVVLLIGLAAFWPDNSLTGYVVNEEVCQGGECLELCDADTDCSREGMVCCSTSWDSGVCDFPASCSAVDAYSAHQSLEVYQDTIREQPSVVQGWTRFFFPLVLTFMLILYFVLRRKDPHW